MKTSFLCLCLLPLCVSSESPVFPVSPGVGPDRVQVFRGQGFKVNCDSRTVKRTRTEDTEVQACGTGDKDFGQKQNSSCFVSTAQFSDSGSYWCEDGSDKSPLVSITVTDSDLILVSPVLPVEAGSNVTLRCRSKHGSGLSPEIYKDGSLVHSGPEWIISNINKIQEGSYSCRGGSVTSAESQLRVKDPPTTTPPPSTISSITTTNTPSTSSTSNTSNTSSPVSPTGSSVGSFALVPVVSAVGALLVLILILILVLAFLRRQRQTGGARGGPDAEDVTYADVRLRPAAAPAASRREEDTVYSGVRTHPREEVTYGEVVVKPKKKKKNRSETQEWADPDVVYSSVRPRNTPGT